MLAEQNAYREGKFPVLAVRATHDTDVWRILLFAGNGVELLVLKRPLGLSLPVLCIPQQERVAENLNTEAMRAWGLETVCVAAFSIPHPDRTSGDARYHIMEVRGQEELSRIAPKTMDVATLKADAFSDVRDYLAVRRAMKLESADSSCKADGPFSELRAFREISTWVEEQLKPLARRCTGAFRQLHASDSFALIRFQTNGGAVWFKATGEPNRRELAITQTLANLFPRHLPELIAVHSDWNAWLTDEIEGTPLDSIRDVGLWCCAAKSLAELQVASIGHASSILARGAHDSRVPKLLSQVAPFFAAIETLMEAQIKTDPRRLYPQEIGALQVRLTKTLSWMDGAAISDTLNHFDLNRGNAILCRGECKFLDWAEAAVGNPFFSFEYLRQHLVRALGDDAHAATEFRKSYTNVWREILPQPTIERTLDLMPLIAPFAFAATLPWNNVHRNVEPEFAGFLRSLARRMHREAEELIRRAA